MKTLAWILLLLLLAAGFAGYHFSDFGAVGTYQSFANELYKLKSGKAKKMILDSAGEDLQRAVAFYNIAYGRLREAPFYPKYRVLQKNRRGFSNLRFKVEQTVKADVPGSTSTFGTTELTYIHEAELSLDKGSWKIARFNLYSKGLENISVPDFSRSVVTTRPSSPMPQTPSKPDTLKTLVSLIQKKAPPIPAADLKTFRLTDGTTVQGKIVHDDPDYYTLETASGEQKIVIKADILK